jgi:hypothetical protein
MPRPIQTLSGGLLDCYEPPTDLTYDTRQAQFRDADHIILTFMGAIPRDGSLWSRHPSELAEKVLTVYRNYTPSSTPSDWLYTADFHVYLKLDADTIDEDFPPFEWFLEKHIDLWEYAAPLYGFQRGIASRANTIIYERRDALTPHPGSPVAPPPTDTDKATQASKHRADMRQDRDTPRFTYRPRVVLNGDHRISGSDVELYARQHINPPHSDAYLDLRFDHKPEDDTTRDEYVPWHRIDDPLYRKTYTKTPEPPLNILKASCIDYPAHLDVTTLNTDFTPPQRI